MATNFPTSVDAFTNPTANDSLNAPSHATQHINSNDAIEAIEGAIIDPAYPDQLVNKTTATVRPLPFATASGIGTLTFSASSNTTIAVTFPASRFTQTPIVTCAFEQVSGSGSFYVHRIGSLTTSGVTFSVGTFNGNSITASVRAHYVATQMTSAAAAG